MEELKVFENSEFGQVRTVLVDEKVYFVGKDVAEILGYTNPQKAIRDHCKGVNKSFTMVQTGEKKDGTPAIRETEITIIPESDIYRLIIKSTLPIAEKFEKWVFDEVLPSIRKHEAYMTSAKLEEVLSDPDTIIRLATDLKNEREEKRQLQTQLETQAPKVLFADAVSSSSSTILIGDLAKILKQKGMDTGQKRLFQILRDKEYLISRKGSDYNSLTQKSMKLGLFEISETAIHHSDGRIDVRKTSKVTGKGQVYFVNLFLRNKVV